LGKGAHFEEILSVIGLETSWGKFWSRSRGSKKLES
jgi:hypothetical protein